MAYNGIQQKATGASLQTDLKGASTQLKLYQVDNGAYPTSNDCSTGPTPLPPKICLKSSSGNTYSSYVADNAAVPQTFSLNATRGSTSYVITHDSPPTLVATVTSCSTGYILVPGSSTYGTSNFCTMKYEAKNVSGVATSQAAGVPWTAISQTTALTTAAAACAGCHLITESEWMTLAQNVLGVASNWSGGSVGSGYVYSGHNDNVPANSLAADSNDANGFYGTGNTNPSNQRRTLTLSNGEVIWDLSGNVREWTSGIVSTGQPGIIGEPAFAYKEWTSVSNPGTLSPSPSPANTGLFNANTWNSTSGMGRLYSYVDDTTTRSFLRGGGWADSGNSGIFGLLMYYSPSSADILFGFRVSK